MSRKLLIGIDGTGAFNDQTYTKEMNGGFISYMCKSSAVPNVIGVHTSNYFRGPTISGLEATGIACRVIQYIMSLVPLRAGDYVDNFLTVVNPMTALNPIEITNIRLRNTASFYDGGIFLAGYSRGGHVTIQVARTLSRARVAVKIIFLFDAVDRDIGMNSAIVPENVEALYHAIRDDGSNSRWYFGHTGQDWRRTDAAKKICLVPSVASFKGSHAALGGLPWEGEKPRKHKISVGSMIAGSAVRTTGIVSNWSPETTGILTSMSQDMLNPPTLSEEADVRASEAAYKWMLENTTQKYGIHWKWNHLSGRAQRRSVDGGGRIELVIC